MEEEVSALETEINKNESQLKTVEYEFSKTSQELSQSIGKFGFHKTLENKQERVKELIRLIRVEQELNIEREKQVI